MVTMLVTGAVAWSQYNGQVNPFKLSFLLFIVAINALLL